MKTTLGLDLGIASVGWALFEEDDAENIKKLIDLGSFVFDEIENKKTGDRENKDRRIKRSMRRQRRRKVTRLQDGKKLMLKALGIDADKIDRSKYATPFEIKVKGLHAPLSKEELVIACLHYLKYRGFKSNRKNEKTADADEKKMAPLYDRVEKNLVERKITSSEYLLEEQQNKGGFSSGIKIHNTSDEFNLTAKRSMYLDEIEKLLTKQIGAGVVDEAFKNAFIALFTRQRDFSEGPGAESPWKHSIEEMIGKCLFDGEMKAARDGVVAKRFVLLSSLVNLRYKKDADDEYQGLTPDQIQEIESIAIRSKSLTYAQIEKKLGIAFYRVKNLSFSRKELQKMAKAFAESHADENGVIPDRFENWTDEMQIEWARECDKKLKEKKLFNNSDLVCALLHKKDGLIAQGLDKEFDGKPEDLEDAVAKILLVNKTDERIGQACDELNFGPNLKQFVLSLPECTQTIDLSVPMCRKIIPLLREGKTYDKALEALGFDHRGIKRDGAARQRIPDIETALRETDIVLRNPVVKHTLVQMIRVVNAIIDTYGAPHNICVEFARELKKSFLERKDIQFNQLDNQYDRQAISSEIIRRFPERYLSVSNRGGNRRFEKMPSSEDVLRYRLWKEQRELSPYTGQRIRQEDIFALCEIDHIYPYSRSMDDSMNNKVLVEKSANQEKGNKTPFEAFGLSEGIRRFLEEVKGYPREKKERLLNKHYESGEFVGKDEGDSAYIARITKRILDFYLFEEGRQCRTVSGAVTAKLRYLYRVSGRTHSFIKGSSYETFYKAHQIDDYVLKSIELNKAEINFVFEKSDGANCADAIFVMKKVEAKKGRELSMKDSLFNKGLEYILMNIEAVRAKYVANGNMTIDRMKKAATATNDGNKETSEILHAVFDRLYGQIWKEVQAKDRSNDLHHALDACVIASAAPKHIKRVTEFFARQERHQEFFETGGQSAEGTKVSYNELLPYEGFDKEILARVYERDLGHLLEILNSLPNYNGSATHRNVHVLYPVRLPERAGDGALSKETVFGSKTDASGRIVAITETKSVSYFDTEKKLNEIYNPNGGNNAVIEALRRWLAIPAKERSKFPVLKNGYPIKRVKICVESDPRSLVDLSEGRFAKNDLVVRVRFYKKKSGDTGRYYLVPVTRAQLARQKLRDRQLKYKKAEVISSPVYTIMWGRGENSSFITEEELDRNYVLLFECPRYSLLELETTNTNEKGVFVYSGGATSGNFEVYSMLGDNVDLQQSGIVGKSDMQQNLITISTIKSVKLHNISVLGKVS